jgi:5-hydroxyisourate hydrolase
MSISTHVLDTARGCPAADIPVTLSVVEGSAARVIRAARTDADGRVGALAPEGLAAGVYEVRFDVGVYHAALGVEGFYPHVVVTFHLRSPDQHHHVPLLISPYGFSTYRGS